MADVVCNYLYEKCFGKITISLDIRFQTLKFNMLSIIDVYMKDK